MYIDDFNKLSNDRRLRLNYLELLGKFAYVDLSYCTNLRYLYIINTGLKEIDLKHCPKLECLNVSYNQITSIDLLYCTFLDSLYINNNPLQSIDVTPCSYLEYVHVDNTQIKSIDLRNCHILRNLPSLRLNGSHIFKHMLNNNHDPYDN